MILQMLLPDYIQTILKIIIVAIIIFGMIMLLLGINHLTHNDDSISEEETRRLEREVRKERSVITEGSVFHKFLARQDSKRK